MRVLLTGASGFLGVAVLRRLLNAGYTVRAFIRRGREDIVNGLDIEVVTGDIIHPQAVERAVDGCDVVFHLASAYIFLPWWEKEARSLYKINVEGTRNILSAALKHKVGRFIFTSSVASIGKRSDGRPSDEEAMFNLWSMSSHYARSKLLAEYEVLKFCSRGLPALILNPAMIIGEGDCKPTPSGELIVKFLNRRYFAYFESYLSIADVNDVADAHISAIENGRTGERYILCSNEFLTLEQIFRLLEEISGIRRPRIKIPYSILLSLVYIEELLSYFILDKKPLMPSEGVKFCGMSIKFDNSKAIKELGYRATPIKETLKRAVNWYKENGYIKDA